MTNPNHNQRHKYHHLRTTLYLTLKMTTAQVVETSVTNNSLSKDYPQPDDHAKQTSDNQGVQTICQGPHSFKARIPGVDWLLWLPLQAVVLRVFSNGMLLMFLSAKLEPFLRTLLVADSAWPLPSTLENRTLTIISKLPKGIPVSWIWFPTSASKFELRVPVWDENLCRWAWVQVRSM